MRANSVSDAAVRIWCERQKKKSLCCIIWNLYSMWEGCVSPCPKTTQNNSHCKTSPEVHCAFIEQHCDDVSIHGPGTMPKAGQWGGREGGGIGLMAWYKAAMPSASTPLIPTHKRTTISLFNPWHHSLSCSIKTRAVPQAFLNLSIIRFWLGFWNL